VRRLATAAHRAEARTHPHRAALNGAWPLLRSFDQDEVSADPAKLYRTRGEKESIAPRVSKIA
jgi:hypothetical protein